MPSIDNLLEAALSRGLDRLDAQVLLAHVLGRDRTWLRTHGQDFLPDAQACRQFEQLGARRLQGEPVAYLTGQREFYGLSLHITKAVLDPRPDTEVLVDWALECLSSCLAAVPVPVVADLGTGSGAIALAVARHVPRAQVLGVDQSRAALDVASKNGAALGLNVDWREGRWLEPLTGSRGHLLLSNPPYIAETDPHLAALHAEPRGALVAAENGLADLHHLIGHAGDWLLPAGWLLLEHGHDQGPSVADQLRAAGFEAVSQRRDLAGHVRCSGGRWPGAAGRVNPTPR